MNLTAMIEALPQILAVLPITIGLAAISLAGLD